MSYAKRSTPLVDLEATLDAALEQHGLAGEGGVAAAVRPALLASGGAVDLDDGRPAWVACVVYDRPETPQVDFFTLAIAFRADGTPRRKANGQVVSVAFWHGVWPDVLAGLSIGRVRRALQMVALGEPQPKVPIGKPAPGGPTERDAIELADAGARSIRVAVTAARELEAPLEDVL